MERYGEFELHRLIATGGMAEIYLGHQAGMEGFSRPVVVKRMLPQLAVRPDFVQMFLDEARLAANLNHPNIVAVTNLGEVGGSYFIAMELVDGPHLGALFAHSLRLRKPLPIEQCCYIVARAADGLHYAHEQRDPATGKMLNLVHRDISPQNILVSREGEVKVTDFGVAKASTHQTKTRTGIIKGKVAYMSPEQCLGEVVDRRTDVFALGIVLYELLTRRRLFRDKSDLLVMQKITGEDVAAPTSINKDLDAELDAICKKALARPRDQRFSNASELAEALDAWLANRTAGDPRVTLARWFEANAGELAVSAGEVTQAHINTASVSRPHLGEATAATPSLNSAETVMTAKSRPEARLPTRSAIENEATRRMTPAATSSADGVDPDAPEPSTLMLRDGELPRPATTWPGAPEEATGGAPAAPESTHHDRAAPGKKSKLPLAAALGAVGVLAVVGVIAFWGDDLPVAADAGPTDVVRADAGTGPVAADVVRLTVNTVPEGVPVFAGKNTFIGNSPLTADLPPGKVQVSAQFADHRLSQEVELVVGQPAAIEIIAKVALKVSVQQGVRATVKVDGKNKGETPLELPAFVEPGKPVKIALIAPGYEARDVEVTAAPGESLVVAETLAPRGAGPPPPPPPPQFGVLHVRTAGVAITQGRLDAERLPELPFRNHRTRSGRRTLVLSNPAERVNESFTVTVPANGEILVMIEFEKRGDRWRAKKPVIK